MRLNSNDISSNLNSNRLMDKTLVLVDVKLVLVGDGNVGKTSLLIRYIQAKIVILRIFLEKIMTRQFLIIL